MAQVRPNLKVEPLRHDPDNTLAPTVQSEEATALEVSLLLQQYELFYRRVTAVNLFFRIVSLTLLPIVFIGGLLVPPSLLFIFIAAFVEMLVWEYERRSLNTLLAGIEEEITSGSSSAGKDNYIRTRRLRDMLDYAPSFRLERVVHRFEPRIWIVLVVMAILFQLFGIVTSGRQ